MRREIKAKENESPETTARNWILKGWHSSATVTKSRGPGEDLYGKYLGRWVGKAGGQFVEVTVRQ